MVCFPTPLFFCRGVAYFGTRKRQSFCSFFFQKHNLLFHSDKTKKITHIKCRAENKTSPASCIFWDFKVGQMDIQVLLKSKHRTWYFRQYWTALTIATMFIDNVFARSGLYVALKTSWLSPALLDLSGKIPTDISWSMIRPLQRSSHQEIWGKQIWRNKHKELGNQSKTWKKALKIPQWRKSTALLRDMLRIVTQIYAELKSREVLEKWQGHN